MVSNYGNREWSISVFAFSICSVFAFSTFLIFSLNIKKRKREKTEMTTFSFHSCWFVVYIVDHYFWSLPPVVCRAIVLRYLCLLAHSGVPTHSVLCSLSCVPYVAIITGLCCVFVLFVFVQFLWIVLCFCFVCLRLVYPMLPVSLDCVVFLFCLSSSCVPYVASFSSFFIFIASSVLSNVYFGLYFSYACEIVEKSSNLMLL